MTRHYDLQARAAAEAEYADESAARPTYQPRPTTGWTAERHVERIIVANRVRERYEWLILNNAPPRHIVATIEHRPTHTVGCSQASHAAEATLIAAAPDLLAACEDIYDFLKSHGYDTRLTRAAIAKARGEGEP